MIGLRSNFAESLALASLVFLIALAGAVVVARRRLADGRPWVVHAARALTVGAIVVVVVATALPRRLGQDTDGDLVLELGRAGLSDWRQALSDPMSLPSLQLFSNVLLYVPVGFGIVVGWYHRRHIALVAGFGLSTVIEAAQFLALGRVAAVDDVVLNVAGAAIGWMAAIVLLGVIDDDRRRALGIPDLP